MRWRVARRCWLSLPFFLGGEHVLGVAVVVGVALEAAAEAGGAVASATVGALGDVLVVGVGGGLGDNDGLVAGGVVHLVDGNVAVGGDGGSMVPRAPAVELTPTVAGVEPSLKRATWST